MRTEADGPVTASIYLGVKGPPYISDEMMLQYLTQPDTRHLAADRGATKLSIPLIKKGLVSTNLLLPEFK